jgi:hypothetical protein
MRNKPFRPFRRQGAAVKKSDKEIVDILVAYDATECVHSAAKIVGCDPKTVRRYVADREAGRLESGKARRPRLIDAYAEKVDEWVDRSEGHISAVRAHERLVRMGFTGSERTTRRMLAEAKARWKQGSRRGVNQPWIPEPGLWLQFAWAEGPVVPSPDGGMRRTALFCGWLAWSRFRIVIPCWERTLPALVRSLDASFRRLGGAPTYVLAVSRGEARIRHPELVSAARHYGVQVRTCVPSEAAPGPTAVAEVRVATSDLVPTETNLRREYRSFAELRAACSAFTDRANGRSHRGGQVAGRTPYERLAVERPRLHPLPSAPHALALGRVMPRAVAS